MPRPPGPNPCYYVLTSGSAAVVCTSAARQRVHADGAIPLFDVFEGHPVMLEEAQRRAEIFLNNWIPLNRAERRWRTMGHGQLGQLNLPDPLVAIATIYASLESQVLEKTFTKADAVKIVRAVFPGATMTEAVGFYERDDPEPSVAVTVVNCCAWAEDMTAFREKIEGVAKQLADGLGQRSVLVQWLSTQEAGAWEVGPKGRLRS